MTYHFLIRGRNCEKYLKECVDSVNAQELPCTVNVFLDNPQDDSLAVANDLKIRHKIDHLGYNHARLGLCGNMIIALTTIQNFTGIDGDDVVCILDADDHLHRKALKYIDREYKSKNILATHGSYIKLSKGRRTRVSKAYKSWEDIRTAPWKASHLKTFRVKLIDHLEPEIFMHNGEFLTAASDLALMMPICELAGWDRVRFIKKEIYYWRDNTPHKTNVKDQKRCEAIIRAKPKLERWCE